MTTGIPAAIAVLLLLVASNTLSSAASTAILTLHESCDKGVGLGKSTVQEYHLLPSGTCKGTKRLAAFSWSTGVAKNVSIPAGLPPTLWTLTTHLALSVA